MTRKTDARNKAIETASRLFRLQGYTATGLTQILAESGAPKGSFYFHFPRGKVQLAEEAIDRYASARMAVLADIAAETEGYGSRFVRRLFATFAAEMAATDFRYGCLMQNLANELPALDAALTERIACGFAEFTAMIAAHFEGCGLDRPRATAAAASLVAALEGARTIARLERTPTVFEALSAVSAARLVPD